ncbi:MAG: CapA family protein [Christensenellaceae bacterium]|jgi:poly-gamma-glutamate synthesis protein (capsule biosynthesis protein)|nr:CapA family protein [Christensenellaceae bacterium]
MLYTRNRAQKPRLNWGRIAFAVLALAIVGASGYFLTVGLMGGPNGGPEGAPGSPAPIMSASAAPSFTPEPPGVSPSPSPSPSPPSSPAPSAGPSAGGGVLHFGAVGEITGGSGLLQGTRVDSSYDFGEVFAKISPYTSRFDFLIGALGTTISKGGEYGERKTPEPMLRALKASGFGVLTLDNGHGYDYGPEGARETRALIEAAGLVGVGFAGEGAEEEDGPCILEGEGLRVAVLSYSLDADETPAESRDRVRLLSEAALSADMLAAEAAGADFVIACVYWGGGGASELTQAQKDWAKKLADAGVGAVIGSQPQYLQKLSTISGANGGQTLVAYSLGSFLTQRQSGGQDRAAILNFDIMRGEDGRCSFANVSYTPTWILRYSTEGRYHYEILQPGEYLNKGYMNFSQEHRNRVRAVPGEVEGRLGTEAGKMNIAQPKEETVASPSPAPSPSAPASPSPSA